MSKEYWTPSVEEIKAGPIREALEAHFEAELSGRSSFDLEDVIDRSEGPFNHPEKGWVDADWGSSTVAPHYKALVALARRVWREMNQ